MSDLKDFENLILQRGLNLEKYSQFYLQSDFQGLFDLAISEDFIELVEYLYLNFEVKFYLDRYTSRLDKNYLNEINLDNGEKGYKIIYQNNTNQSLEYLKEMRKYSKIKKDEKGFYYIYKK